MLHEEGSGYTAGEKRILNWISPLAWNGLQLWGITGDLKRTYRKW